MKRLIIEGVIARKSDAAAMAPGEKSFSFEDLQNYLDASGGEPFEVVINSIGGSVDEGFKIYNALKELGVTTTALRANSIASVIFMAGETRRVTPTSEIIIHNAWVDAKDLAGERLNVHTLEALKQLFEMTDAEILGIYTEAAGKDKETAILGLMAAETNLGAEKALELGLATELTEEFSAVTLKNKVLTFSRNQLAILNIQDGPITTYADVLYVNGEGGVLLLQRKEDDSFEPGKWGFPGGKVMQGETIETGAARELKEETGISAQVERLNEVVNEDESLTVYFKATGSEEPTSLPEHKTWKWAKLADLENLPLIMDQKERYANLIKSILNKNTMHTEEKLNAFEKMLNGLKNLFKTSLKNMAAVTKEGVAIFIAGAEDGELVGKTVYIAEEGLPTDVLAPAGEHTLEDGSVIVLDANGVITEVKPAIEVEDLAAKMAEKDKELQAKEAEIMDLKNQIKALKESDTQKASALEGLKNEFASLKNQIVGDPDDKKKAPKVLPAEEFAKLSPSEKIRLRAMNKATA